MTALSFIVSPDLIEPANAAVYGNVALRILLSATTLVSGVGKVMDPAGSRQAMGDFGVPSRLVEPAARALPVVEITLGAAILVDALAPAASLGLALLFLLFSLGIGNLLRQEKAPPCNCFGAVHSEPVSGFTLARAVTLFVLACYCFFLTVFPLTPGLKSLLLVLLGYAAVGRGVRVWVTQRQKKGLHKKVKRLNVGQRIPSIKTTDGQWLDKILSSNERTLLVLTSPGCGHCQQAKVALADWAPTVADDLSIVELRSEDTAPDQAQEQAFPKYIASPKDFGRFFSPTPGAFLVDKKGSLLAPPVAGIEEIEALARVALRGLKT